MRRQTALHIGLAERQTGLPQVTAVGAQDADLPPVETRQQDQAVETVVLGLVAEQVFEQLEKGSPGCLVVEIRRRQQHGEIGQMQVTPGQAERLFREHRQPHVFEHRQDRREGRRATAAKQLQVLLSAIVSWAALSLTSTRPLCSAASRRSRSDTAEAGVTRS
jgi:hypothetical protein